MPLYEYRCEACGEVSEILHKISDPTPEACPQCKLGPLKKLISAAAFHLKGGGWYSDGYTGASNKKSADVTSSDKKPSDSKSGDEKAKPAEAKPAASESKPTTTAKKDS